MIEVQNLCKYYGNRCAVNNISFNVAEGEIVGFLGPNGAGKTTTLRVLTCYHPASSGAARIAGHDVFTESMAVRRVVGYLPESVPLYLEMRVREYLNFRGKIRGLTKPQRQAAIARVVQRAWLGDVIDRPIGQLSKGFRQRVGLADALLHNPRVLILDEPTVGLDPAQIRETRSLIRELAREHTLLFSSHILPEVEATCQRILLINHGRIIASGTADELKRRADKQVRVVAELKGAEADILKGVRGLQGCSAASAQAENGWVRVRIESSSDLRQPLAELSNSHGWALRELRRESATLEDFFVQAVLETSGSGESARKAG